MAPQQQQQQGLPSQEKRDSAPPGTSRTVNLASGGTLTISATLDLFSLSPPDRNFVFGLIDELDKYEAGGRKTAGPNDKEEKEG